MKSGPSDADLDRAAEVIRQGGLVAFPTETVYGLGANALDAAAVAKIFAVKERPWASPLIVHVADEGMARAITAEWPNLARQLTARFWPGPLTLVLRKAAMVPDVVTAGLDTVGVRMPSHPVALELIRRAGVPLAAPSANLFSEISPTTAGHVRQSLGGRVELILDAGPTEIGIESTVVSLRRNPPTLLRPGMITAADLEGVSGVQWVRELDVPHVPESPGMHPRHYAPRTPFFVLEPGSAVPPGTGRLIEMPSDRREYAARLYSKLRSADREGWAWLAVRRPPAGSEWDGIIDRLTRACCPE